MADQTTPPPIDRASLTLLEQEIRAAFEAGHWHWPTVDTPTRHDACDRYVRERLAILSSTPHADV